VNVRRELPGGFELDDDRARIDVPAVHAFISKESYWGAGSTRERVRRAIDCSTRVLGLYHGERQVGFARAVSDCATVAYLADVYVLAPFRGRGLGLELVREIVDGGPRWEVRWLLHTADAHALYAKLGFTAGPPRYPSMEREPGRGPAKQPCRGKRRPAGGAAGTGPATRAGSQ
jgi:GNAT superfamily N-acetyltransferase